MEKEKLQNKEQTENLKDINPEEIKDEVSLTSGHDYKTSSVTASSGKRRYSFFSQKNFAWLLDDQEEKKFIQLMKKATDIIVKARTTWSTFSTRVHIFASNLIGLQRR